MRKRLAPLIAAILAFFIVTAATLVWCSHVISKTVMDNIGNEAIGYATVAASSIRLTDAQVAQLKTMTPAELASSAENRHLETLFRGESVNNHVDYAYIMVHLDENEVRYHVTEDNTTSFNAPVGTPLDIMWLLDVSTTSEEQAPSSDNDDPLSRYSYWNEQDETIFSQAPVSVLNDDEWGRHVCGYAPFYTIEGTYVGVMGVDLSINDYDHAVTESFTAMALVLVIGVVGACCLFAVYLVNQRRLRREQRVANERYLILMDTNTPTFDYDIAADELTFSVMDKNGTLVENTASNYLKHLDVTSNIEQDSLEGYQAMIARACKEQGTFTHEFKADFGMGSCWYCAHFVSVADDKGSIYRVVGRIDDIQREKAIEEHAKRDPLSGLLNRGAAEKEIEEMLGSDGGRAAFILLDIDDFKGINDTFGHGVGDKAIQHVSTALLTNFRTDDITYRLGGDEFAVFIKTSESTDLASLLEAKAHEVQRCVSETGPTLPDELEMSVSIGIAVDRPDEPTTLDGLYRRADENLYVSKRGGKARCTIDERLY